MEPIRSLAQIPVFDLCIKVSFEFRGLTPFYRLKYELSGFRSIRVKRNFLILYGICRECKKSKEMSGSTSCPGYGDNAVVVYAFGPHDDLYKIARKIIQKKAKR